AINVASLPKWGQLLLMLILADFISYWIHRLLHRVPFLWEFHKVHHSVQEMGFAAHLRYHWIENVVYKTLQYIPLAMIGFGINDFIIIHIFNLAWGHFNHANTNISIGWLAYIFNSPRMHIWHHARNIPEGRHGVNFGLTFSIWDYIFGTDYIPKDGRDIPLGFEDVEEFPKGFISQQVYPLKIVNKKKT
ncbi:MAG: sterol desaturase family protein, partial [Saprospiraceae bacterium]